MIVNIFNKKIPAKLPINLEKVANEIGRHSQNQEECLKATYDFLTKRYRGYRVKTYTRLANLLTDDLDSVWAKRGFLHCMTLNYLMRILLVRSGHFEESATKQRWTTIWLFSPHQYLRIKLDDGRTIDIDMWGKAYGIPFGEYSHGFNSKLSSASKT